MHMVLMLALGMQAAREISSANNLVFSNLGQFMFFGERLGIVRTRKYDVRKGAERDQVR